MSSNPYENEPGFEDAKSDHDQKNMTAYRAKVYHISTCVTPFNLLIAR
jgi:ubiquitin-conjugating enzyme E2 Z